MYSFFIVSYCFLMIYSHYVLFMLNKHFVDSTRVFPGLKFSGFTPPHCWIWWLLLPVNCSLWLSLRVASLGQFCICFLHRPQGYHPAGSNLYANCFLSRFLGFAKVLFGTLTLHETHIWNWIPRKCSFDSACHLSRPIGGVLL